MSLVKSLCRGIQTYLPMTILIDINPIGTGIVEQEEADVQRDKIAQDMWDHYRHVCEERGIDTDESGSDKDEDEYSSSSNDTVVNYVGYAQYNPYPGYGQYGPYSDQGYTGKVDDNQGNKQGLPA